MILKSTSSRLATATLAVVALGVLPSGFAAEKANLTARAAATQKVSFEVFLPVQHRDQLNTLINDLHNSASPSFQKWLKPAEFSRRFDPSPQTLSAIEHELAAEGLTTKKISARHLHVTGAAASVESALGTTLQTGAFPDGKPAVAASQAITPTRTMTAANAVVVGLSGMMPMRSHAQRSALPQNRYATYGYYWFDDLKQAYQYPAIQALNGSGVTIGILMSGDISLRDMNLYFGHEKIATPHFTEVRINGGAPYDPNTPGTFEATLDLQQSGGMAPSATVTLYNVPSLYDSDILTGLSQMVTDNRVDVVSMSFGLAEVYYTALYNNGIDYTSILSLYDDYFAQGNSQGITFVASSGDAGALAAEPLACFDPFVTVTCGNFVPSVESPASSPHVTAVGGTNLVTVHTAGSLDSTYVREQAFADPLAPDTSVSPYVSGGYWGSGGGDSVIYPKPSYQYFVDTGNESFRTVPDVSLHMGGCPGGAISCSPDDSADLEVLGGKLYGVIGTSASSPDFAGLTALSVQQYGHRVGNFNYYIYALAAAQSLGLVDVFHTNIPGFNGLYYTTPTGYNRVLGNGTVKGVNFLLAPLMPQAGIPQTPTNP